jgi:PAS domain S-box-containing protein
MLRGVDADLVRAASREEALRHLLEEEFAAVLLEVRVPASADLETARLVRAQPALNHVPFIFVTDFEPGADVAGAAHGLGAVDFVLKPVEAQALRAKLGSFVERFLRDRSDRQLRARYDALSELVPVGVFQTDPEGDCLWVNPRWCEIAGLSPEEARGKGWSAAIHPDDRERVFREWYDAAKGGTVFRSEYRFQGREGLVTWVLGQAKAETDWAGRTIGYVGTITDITDRKQAEDALRIERAHLERRVEERTRDLYREAAERSKAEEEVATAQGRLRLIINQVPACISYVDREGRYVYVNKTYEAWLGRPAESLPGKHLREVLGEQVFGKIRPHVEAALQGDAVEYENELPMRGEMRTVRVCYAPDRSASGEVSGFVALVTDVTEHKAHERENRLLADAGALLAHSLDAERTIEEIPALAVPALADWCVINLSSEDGRVQRAGFVHRDPLVTEKARRELPEYIPSGEDRRGSVLVIRDGVPKVYPELEEQDLRELAADEAHECLLREMGARSAAVLPLRTRGRSLGAVILVRGRDGARFGPEDLRIGQALADRAALALDNARLLRHLQELTRDLERRVRERTAEVQGAMRQLEAFAYTIAHDLRAPVRAMTGFSEALIDDYGKRLDPEGIDYLQRIRNGGKRMDAMISDLLDYSRLVRGELPLEEVDLGSAVDRALSELEAELSQRRAAVEVERPLPRVRAHGLTLALALQNLISNAAKFVAPGTEPRIRIRATLGASGVRRLWVEDNGIGIAPEHQDRIFGVFERLHRSDAYPGTGIGLAIVRKALERMGGRVGLESKPGKGSRFFLEFPPGT